MDSFINVFSQIRAIFLSPPPCGYRGCSVRYRAVLNIQQQTTSIQWQHAQLGMSSHGQQRNVAPCYSSLSFVACFQSFLYSMSAWDGFGNTRLDSPWCLVSNLWARQCCAMQGVLQSLTSTVGSAASTVTSGAKSAVNRLTGESNNNGFAGTSGPLVSTSSRPLALTRCWCCTCRPCCDLMGNSP